MEAPYLSSTPIRAKTVASSGVHSRTQDNPNADYPKTRSCLPFVATGPAPSDGITNGHTDFQRTGSSPQTREQAQTNENAAQAKA
jgi:hypothetical protein